MHCTIYYSYLLSNGLIIIEIRGISILLFFIFNYLSARDYLFVIILKNTVILIYLFTCGYNVVISFLYITCICTLFSLLAIFCSENL